ncbi:MAG TPA: glycosyltransferase [Solirubrobacteraceae bacterium]|jgi:glycosyltransferase involved in cell wall biosynthesis|nr:glycosyltransferase [Solirubrobacteraceae bacterium]
MLRRRARNEDRPVLCFATQGHEHIEGHRIRRLLEGVSPESFPFDHAHRLSSALGLLRVALRRRPSLIVMEGTGLAGGLTLLAIDALLGIPYVFSSGDAVGPYLRLRSPLLGPVGGLYERLLYRRCAGFVGWTPYLVGRALTFGAPRGVTAPGWSRSTAAPGARERVRRRLGIPLDALVVGLTGSLHWSERRRYVYGAELVSAVRRLERRDVVACIVGDGSGLDRLKELAGEDLGTRVVLAGRVPPEEVPDYLSCFDMASLSQSTDRVGSFRYTTKLSEYLDAGLPVISGQNPVAYDLDEGCFWRVPGDAPWSPVYIDALQALLEALTATELSQRRQAVRERATDAFDLEAQQRRVADFIRDLMAGRS